MSFRTRWRKFVNVFMLSLTGVCALVTVSVLFFILGYLLWYGGKSLNWAFFTHLPTPVGETGGGMANAIVGSGKLLLLASLVGVPVGILGGVYLAEFGGQTFSFVVRYTTDLLNGVPSIVMGIFAYTIIVLPMQPFLGTRGWLGAGGDDDSHRGAHHGGVLARGPGNAAGRRPGARNEQVEDRGDGGHAGGHARHRHRRYAHPGARGGRNRSPAFHRLQQPLLEFGLESTHRLVAGDDLHLRDCSLRRLASASLGGRVGSFGVSAGGQYWGASAGFQGDIFREGLNRDFCIECFDYGEND